MLTTLDRLHKKGYLLREKQGKAFVYAPRYTRAPPVRHKFVSKEKRQVLQPAGKKKRGDPSPHRLKRHSSKMVVNVGKAP